MLAVAVPAAPVAAPLSSGDAERADRAAASGAPPAAPDASPAHWKMGLAAFVVLGACYVGAYELLTAEAQRERANLLQVHGPAIESFPDPGPPPMAEDAKALRDYRPAHERWVDRGRYEALGTRVRAMFLGMLGAFAPPVRRDGGHRVEDAAAPAQRAPGADTEVGGGGGVPAYAVVAGAGAAGATGRFTPSGTDRVTPSFGTLPGFAAQRKSTTFVPTASWRFTQKRRRESVS